MPSLHRESTDSLIRESLGMRPVTVMSYIRPAPTPVGMELSDSIVPRAELLPSVPPAPVPAHAGESEDRIVAPTVIAQCS